MKAKPAFVGARQRAQGTQFGWKPAKHRPRRPAPPPAPDPLALARKVAEARDLASVAGMLHDRDQATAQAAVDAYHRHLVEHNQLNTQRLVRTILEHDEDGEVIGSHQEFIP